MSETTDPRAARREAHTRLLKSPCVSPLRLRVGDEYVNINCSNTYRAKCPSCSARFIRQLRLRIASGIEPVFGQEPGEGHLVFVTLTAPSFGSPVHNRDKRTGRCTVCNATHSQTDEVLGFPVKPGKYRFWQAVQWNHLAPRLWHAFITELRRLLPEETVEYFVAAEMQTRITAHYHAIIRVTGNPEATEAAIRRARTVQVNPPSEVTRVFDGKGAPVKFGRQIDIQHLPARSEEANARVAYVTKSVAAYASKDMRQSQRGEPSKIARSMRATAARYLPHLGHMESLGGYVGARYSFSRNWGLSAREVSLHMTLGWMRAHGKAAESSGIEVAERYVRGTTDRLEDVDRQIVHEGEAIHDGRFYLRNSAGLFPSEHNTDEAHDFASLVDELTEAVYGSDR